MTDYATLAEVKAEIGKTLTTDDTVISTMITAASRAVDRYCNRNDNGFVAGTATARLFVGRGGTIQPVDECTSITAVAVKTDPTSDTYDSWSTGDWIAFRGDPAYPEFNQTPYTGLMVDPTGDQSIFTSGAYSAWGGIALGIDEGLRGVPTVQITAKWGYADTVPSPIKQATIILAARWYKRGQSAFADTLASADFGTLLYRQPIDPAVKFILQMGRFVRPSVG